MGLPKTLLVSERGQKKDKTIPAGIAFMCKSIMCAVEGFDLSDPPWGDVFGDPEVEPDAQGLSDLFPKEAREAAALRVHAADQLRRAPPDGEVMVAALRARLPRRLLRYDRIRKPPRVGHLFHGERLVHRGDARLPDGRATAARSRPACRSGRTLASR